jgi:hypothetical protein
MAVAPPHVFGLVPHPSIDQPLVDPFRRAIARERVPEDMPAMQLSPFASIENPPEILRCALHGQLEVGLLANRWLASGMFCEPSRARSRKDKNIAPSVEAVSRRRG